MELQILIEIKKGVITTIIASIQIVYSLPFLFASTNSIQHNHKR